MQTRGFAAYLLVILYLSLYLFYLDLSLTLFPRDRLLYKPGTMHGRKDRHTRARYPGTDKHPNHDLQGVILNSYIVEV